MESKVSEILKHFNLEEFGFAALSPSLSLERYQAWLSKGYHGQMSFMDRHLEIKKNPTLKYPEFKSAIVLRKHYFNNLNAPERKFPGLKVALYANAPDYHDEIPKALQPIVKELRLQFPGESFVVQTDSGPILERDLAYRAGLGWFGKNSMLIDEKKGSFFFIAEILTSLNLKSITALHPDRCGTCTRCIDACPTQAILPERQIDARRCVSYLNIESKTLPPAELRSGLGDWFFGCDICQAVCPWNEKAFGTGQLNPMTQSLSPLSSQSLADLKFILEASDEQLKADLTGYPLLRPKPWGLRRNALVIVGNHKIYGLRLSVEKLSDPRLFDLQQWVLEQLVT